LWIPIVNFAADFTPVSIDRSCHRRFIVRITETALRRMIRRELLREAAVTPEEAQGMGVEFRIMKSSGTIGRAQWSITANTESYTGGPPWRQAIITIAKPVKRQGKCNDAWEVTWSLSDIPKLGPLLYDIAMEIATLEGGGLMSDRIEVSDKARRVWRMYGARGDIEKYQLDNLRNELTPETDEDNCQQDSAEYDADVAWEDSPLSKRYLKNNPSIIAKLRDLGMIKAGSDMPRGL
jgi:hypothetical protein